ncbi:MAG: DnaJ domain-containing protein [Sphingomonadaceae bacterium]|nr:DnaJ domain-containing protein [Sphingomonadaceae bacterium]
MAGRRSLDWGFPRWRDYGTGGAATALRPCDRDGCDRPGDHPAPKAPNRPDRWWFCEAHAAEYNRGWDYFAGLSAEQAREREAGATGESGFTRARHWGWGGTGDGSRSRAELDALAALDLPPDADAAAIKAAHRRLAKANHPDATGGDAAAAARFQVVQAAYDILVNAEEQRQARTDVN